MTPGQKALQEATALRIAEMSAQHGRMFFLTDWIVVAAGQEMNEADTTFVHVETRGPRIGLCLRRARTARLCSHRPEIPYRCEEEPVMRYILTLHDGRALLWEGDIDELLQIDDLNSTIFTTAPDGPKSNIFLKTNGGQYISFDYVAVIDPSRAP